MPLARQPGRMPTNKLTAATLAVLVTSALMEVLQGWAAIHAPFLAGPSVETLVVTLAPLVVGYLVPDRINLPVS